MDPGYCSLCQKQFKGARGLSVHMRWHKKQVVEKPVFEMPEIVVLQSSMHEEAVYEICHEVKQQVIDVFRIMAPQEKQKIFSIVNVKRHLRRAIAKQRKRDIEIFPLGVDPQDIAPGGAQVD